MTATGKKRALITGGTGGLGSRLAARLYENGYRVAINFHRDRAGAERLVSEMGGGAFAVKADVGDPGQVEDMARAVKDRWGGLDALVNCAGITKDALLVKLQPASWDEVIRTNLTGVFNTIKAFAPIMAESGGGHIINISSYSGLKGKKGQSAYSASKAALIGLTVSAAAELGRHSIRVNAVLPGYMPTRMGENAEAAMNRAREDSFLGRLSDPEEAASFITLLAGMECVTGQVYPIESRVF
ncbi:MAG: SDR family NAD(P)-dependent oxidoreductase [Nitrospiraceae bacterium]|nr:SDR family NAD(P)-dependent oxidoreductase [Nitrospiraceae bacterium]